MGAVAQPPHEQVPSVLLVDQHPAAREGLARRLEQDRGFQVCGEAGDLPGAVQLLVTEPDVVVMDVAIKGGSGLDLIKRIRERRPTTQILVWSRYRESIYAERVLRAGAAGYIEKTQPTVTVVDAIRHIVQGKVYLSPAQTELLLRQAGGKGNGFATDPVAALSDRELEVFRMIGMCRPTQEIAKELHLSLKTVETYRGRIKTKFGADSSAELFALAVHWELDNG
jgi:DNA-binding NarL/FixJ family response regulator